MIKGKQRDFSECEPLLNKPKEALGEERRLEKHEPPLVRFAANQMDGGGWWLEKDWNFSPFPPKNGALTDK